jgi:type IV pilus assembly protein PilQ
MRRLGGALGLAGLLLLASCQRIEEGRQTPPPKPANTANAPKTPATNAPPTVLPKPETNAPPVMSPKQAANTPPVMSPKQAANTPPAPVAEKPKEPPKITYSASHDDDIKKIFDLAGQRRWEEAEALASGLVARDPQDAAAQRLWKWVKEQRERQREQALEDKIRTIDSQNSVFNPTVKDLLTEKKDRGLPPRKDVRDMIQKIQSTPYIPESYGKTNYLEGRLFDFESRQGRMNKVLDKEVTIKLENATLESIIFNLGETEGINFVADKSLPAFQQKLSVNMGRVKLGNFLKYVSRNMELQFQVGDDLIWIVDAKNKEKVLEETRFYRLRKGFILPAEFGPPEVVRTDTTQAQIHTVTEVQKMAKFVNDLASTVPAMERAITNFFMGSKYFIDYERNVIVARGTPEQLEVMERIIETFDRPLQQVLIQARFVTVSEAAFLQLGMNWGSGAPASGVQTPTDQTGLAPTTVAPGFAWNWTNVFGVPNLSATLTALNQSGESQTLSAPSLVVVNNLPATISDGQVQYYYEQYTVKAQILQYASSSQLVPDGKPTKITAGASLDVLASIGGDGKTIILALNPRVNSTVTMVPFATISDHDVNGNVSSTFDIKLPTYRTDEMATRVSVRSGGTVVMGGVLERTQVKYIESVPVLGNLPFIGGFFRRRTELDRPRYLLIFVTATVLAETGEYVVPREDEAEQDRSGVREPGAGVFDR